MPRSPETSSVGQAASLSPCPMFHWASESGTGAGKLAARPTERAARVCRQSRPVENVSGPDFSRLTEIALRVGGTTGEWGDVEICRETLDKTTCPVPVPCPIPAPPCRPVRSRARSTSPERARGQRTPWSTRAWLLLSLEGRASHSAAKHVAIFIQPQNGGLNKIDFLRRALVSVFRTGRNTEAKSQSIVRSPGRGGTPRSLTKRGRAVQVSPPAPDPLFKG